MLVGLTALLARADGPPPRTGLPPAPQRPKEFQAQVNRAIDRGVEWLRARRQKDGGFRGAGLDTYGHGPTALAVLTLRACGVPADDPAIRRGIDLLRAAYETGERPEGGNTTYGVSLTLLALEWQYEPDPPGVRSIPEADRAWIRHLAKLLLRSQTTAGGFGYEPRNHDYQDRSNSQFALLGLGAAQLLGENVEPDVWRKALVHWLRSQEPEGPEVERYEEVGVDEPGYGKKRRKAGVDQARGWGYRNDSPSGSMTAGGVSSVALCRDALAASGNLGPKLDEASLTALRDGVAWLGRCFTVEGNPFGAPVDLGGLARQLPFQYYYLYGLERAGVLARTAWMGEHDWYLEGAEYLLRAQDDDGHWEQEPSRPGLGSAHGALHLPQVDTCFALLFLKRATRRLESTATLVSGGVAVSTEDDLDPSRGPDLEGKALRDLFEAAFQRYRQTPSAEREKRAVDFVRMGPRSIPLLVFRLEDDDVGLRGAAAGVLAAVTEDGPAFDATAPAAEREKAVVAWEAWWVSRRGRLRADVRAGRFVLKSR